MNYVREYWERISSGEIVTSRRVKAVYGRLVAEMDAADESSPYYFDEAVGERPIIFVERFCKQSQGTLGESLTLELFQKAYIQLLFGWLERATGYNRTAYNRTLSIVFEWLATANAEADTSATLRIIRYMGGSAVAVSTASGEYVRVFLPSALAEAEAGSIGDYIRTLFFSALAEAIATATGAGVSTYGSVTLVIEGVNMVAGDELIIDTEHMTVTLNGANIIDRVSDDSAFFKLQPGENDIIVEGGTTADVKILWKDRWL